MPRSYRLGTALLGLCGFALTALMLYAIGFPGDGAWSSSARAVDAEVDVFFPDLEDWRLFRSAAHACVGRKLATLEDENDESITLRTIKHQRRVRIRYRNVRGHLETRNEVRRLFDESPHPVAVVGSVSSVLTVALAETLNELFPDRKAGGPALLIPWASAVQAKRPGKKSPTAVPLLDLYHDRSFRYCSNDQRHADLVVDALQSLDPEATPAQVHFVVDPRDPYSVDLADCFQRSIRGFAPQASITVRPDVVGEPSLSLRQVQNAIPNDAEQRLADQINQLLRDIPESKSCWVVLPLLADPARQMLTAMRRVVPGPPLPGEGEGRLRVICGDGIGIEVLEQLKTGSGFPIWSISSDVAPPPDYKVDLDTQILAEIVASLLATLDRPTDQRLTGALVAESLRRLKLEPGDPYAFGRPLSFADNGERTDDGDGQVHALRIDPARVITYVKSGDDWAPAGKPVAAQGGPRP